VFWRIVNSKKSHSSIPSYGDVVAFTEADIANWLAACFSSNIEPSHDWYDQETLNIISEICNIASLGISYDDISEAISYFDYFPRPDFDGIS